MKKLAKNQFLDIILKRSSWILAIYTMILNASIVFTFAKQASLTASDFIIPYMFILGFGGYCLIVFTLFKTMLDLFNLNKEKKEKRDLGEDDEEEEPTPNNSKEDEQ